MKIRVWKFLHCKLGRMLKSDYMRNACGTGHILRLVEAHRERHPSRHFSTALEHDRAQAIIRVDAADAPARARPRSGGRIGDSNEPELFMQAFYKPVSRRKQEMSNMTGPLLQSRRPSPTGPRA
eukprot:6680609-Pyramimonas_sp.AAC.1